MTDFVARYFQFIIMLTLWCVGAIFGNGSIAMILIGLSLLFLFVGKRYMEIFMGFFFVLILSDNLNDSFEFAKSFKNIYIVFLLAILIVNYSSFYPLKGMYIYFIPFFIIASLGLMYSGNLVIGIQKTISYLLILILIPNFLVIIFKNEGPQALKDLAHFFLCIIIIGFLVVFLNYEFAFIEGGRLRGFFGNPNGLGIFLFLIYMFYLVINNFYPDLFTYSERIIFNLVVFSAIVLCGSRSAMVSIFILLLFYRLQNNSALLGILVFALIIVSYQFITSNFVMFVKYAGLNEYLRVNTLEEGSGRFVAWAFAWEKIQDFYYIGGGFGNDEFVMRQNYRYLSFLGHQGGVHNSYLTFWFDAGLFGIIFYFRAFILLFIDGAKKTIYAIPCLYSILFSITYESWLAGSLNPFTVILFLTISLFFCEEFVVQKDMDQEVVPNGIKINQ